MSSTDWTPSTSYSPGDVVKVERNRSRWAIIWERIKHPLISPNRTETARYEAKDTHE